MPFLSRLSEDDRDALARRWAVRAVAREETILARDEPGREVFFVLDGRARATTFSAAGRAVAYRDIEPGDFFGELAAIDGLPRSADVVALLDTRVARLPEAAFRELVETRKTFAWELLKHLAAQMRRMTERVHEVSTLVVRERLVRELLRLCAPEDGGRAGIVAPAPTHYELATRISSHREAVSREMSLLAKRGLVAKQGSRLLLRDLETLQALADSAS